MVVSPPTEQTVCNEGETQICVVCIYSGQKEIGPAGFLEYQHRTEASGQGCRQLY